MFHENRWSFFAAGQYVVQILSPVQIAWDVVLPRKVGRANSLARIRPTLLRHR